MTENFKNKTEKEILEQLSKSCNNLNQTELLFIFAKKGYLKAIKKLIEINDTSLLETRDSKNRTLAHIAAFTDNLDLLEFLVINTHHRPRFLELEDVYGFPPAPYAAGYGYLDILKYLVAYSASGVRILTSVDRIFNTPVYYAVKESHINVIEYIIQQSPDGAKILEFVYKYSGSTFAHIAAENSNLELLMYLVEKAPSGVKLLEIKNKYGDDVASIALRKLNYDMLKYTILNSENHCNLLDDSKSNIFINYQRTDLLQIYKKELIQHLFFKEFNLIVDICKSLEKINGFENILCYQIFNMIMQHTQLLISKKS